MDTICKFPLTLPNERKDKTKALVILQKQLNTSAGDNDLVGHGWPVTTKQGDVSNYSSQRRTAAPHYPSTPCNNFCFYFL